jgi:D-alanyl-D-alanine endopeptidase (penicillin-binding protein 7)
MADFFRTAAASFLVTSALILGGALYEKLGQDPVAAATIEAPSAVLAVAAAPLSVPPVQASLLAVSAAPASSPPVTVAAADLHPVAEVDAPPLEAEPDGFVAPAWFPAELHENLLAVEAMEGAPLTQGGPDFASRAVFVYDLDAGKVLIARNADDRRPVASLTKLVGALAAMTESPNLDQELCLQSIDRPSLPGTASKLRSGTCATGWDFLGASLVRSDNGAAYAMSGVAGLPFETFVERMNSVAGELGMSQSTFADPSGAEDENLSTARDMTRAVLAASLHPSTAAVVNAPYWDFHDISRDRVRRLYTTDRIVERKDIDVLGAKTGYTDTARYCFTAVIRTEDGRRVAFTMLGAPRNRNRWRDVDRLIDWLNAGGGR